MNVPGPSLLPVGPRACRRELSLASLSSLFFGFGVVFLFLWAGLWL